MSQPRIKHKPGYRFTVAEVAAIRRLRPNVSLSVVDMSNGRIELQATPELVSALREIADMDTGACRRQ